MYEYSHGGNAAYEGGKEGLIDLSASINPLGMPDGVADAIVREIRNCECYPDSYSQKLREKVAEYENADPDCVFCGGGASDIIFRLPRAINAKKVMVTAPTFSDYERSARSYGAEVYRHTLSEAGGFAVDSSYTDAALRDKPDLVYICNPNNPTGRLTDAKLINELLDCCRQLGATVVVDECFLEFADLAGDYTSKVFLSEYPNLVVLKAFTKLFALPGIRLGYALCTDKALLDSLYYHGADWPVSTLAQAAGLAALDSAGAFTEKTRMFVAEEREKMENELSSLGFKVYKAEANYVFFQNPYALDLGDRLDRLGIRIRSCSNYHGLDGSYYRIAVSTEENNAKLLSCIYEETKNAVF